MRTVVFRTEKSEFQFDREYVKEHLYILATEYEVDEALTLLNRIKISSVDQLTIHEEHDYFGYIVLDLIGAGKGSVTCEVCGRSYKPNQLKSITIGHGKSPFGENIKKKWRIKGLFKKKHASMFGGKGYECPEGHLLISMITWRT